MARVPTKHSVPKAGLPRRGTVSAPTVDTGRISTRPQLMDSRAGQVEDPSLQALANLGEAGMRVAGEIWEAQERDRNNALDAELADAELEAARHKMEIETNLEVDPDYRTYRPRYESLMGDVGKSLSDRISDPERRAKFQRRFAEDTLRGAHAQERRALKADIDAKTTGLDSLLDGYKTRLSNADLTDEDRELIESDAEEAVLRLTEKGGAYLTRQQARKKLKDFYEQAEADRIIALTNAGRFEEARSILDQPSKLDAIAGSWKHSPDGDRKAQTVVAEVALEEGRSPSLLLAIGDIESDGTFDIKSGNPRSSAQGIFHFLDENREWALEQGVPYGGDAESQTRAMIAKMDSDGEYFARASGRAPQPWEEYILHFQGAPVGTTLLLADPEMPLAAAMGERADLILDANPNLKKYKSVGEFLDHYATIFEGRMEKFQDASAPVGSLRNTQKRALLDRINSAERKMFAQDAAELELLIDDDVKSIEATGQGVQGIDMQRAKLLLGEKKYADYVVDRRQAEAVYSATNDLPTLPANEISARLEGIRPEPGVRGYAAKRQVYEKVEKKAKELARLRRDDPAKAVADIDFVREAAAGDDGSPEGKARVIRARLKAQTMIGIPPAARTVITRDEARLLLAPIASLARAAKTDPQANKDLADQFANVITQAEELYGSYAKSALDTALAQMTGAPDATDRLTGHLRRAVRDGTLDKPDMKAFGDTMIDMAEERALNPDAVDLSQEKTKDFGKQTAAPTMKTSGKAVKTESAKPTAGHINYLRDHPTPKMIEHFNKKFGKGAAEKVLNGEGVE